jgi:hypothetical protein
MVASTQPAEKAGNAAYKGFSDTIGREKCQRQAKECLRDLMLFNNALESELQSLGSARARGAAVDSGLLEKMALVKDKYTYAMTGLRAFDDEMQRFALSALADAIQDLMFYVHNRRKNA